jgi:hypothetical protein
MHTEASSTQKEEQREWRRKEGRVGGSESGGAGGGREKCIDITVALHACKKSLKIIRTTASGVSS